jgi:cyclin-dependent kinase 12/13
MGCISSKHAAKTSSPAPTVGEIIDVVPSSKGHSGLSVLESKSSLEENKNRKFKKNSSKKSSGSAFSFRIGFTQRFVEAEQNAAGWPPWLTASAAEAVQGWIPLKADAFQKLDKVITLLLHFALHLSNFPFTFLFIIFLEEVMANHQSHRRFIIDFTYILAIT